MYGVQGEVKYWISGGCCKHAADSGDLQSEDKFEMDLDEGGMLDFDEIELVQ